LLILAGLAGLLVGAELLVRGSNALASRLGIRPMVIGLTVVSLGTSLPELAIGVDAARQGSPGLAVGNIVGTNLVDILFILGLSALMRNAGSGCWPLRRPRSVDRGVRPSRDYGPPAPPKRRAGPVSA
jgi:Ca2+/Na+ antiporter